MVDKVTEAAVVGGVDTHKDLHVAAVVDQNNKVLGTQYFSTTRQGYRQMLAWMTSFGTLKRIGVECTGTYGSGLLRYFQNAGLEVLEVTAPDRMERRKRGKSDTIDAECAAHAAFSGIGTVTPKTRDGMIESLRVLKTCRKTAISGVVCGRGRNPTLRLWPAIFSGKIDVFPGDRRSRLISSMTSVAPA